jgi:hypothetical protein
VEQRKQGHGYHGHFLGYWVRLNCENLPVIPAWLVRRCFGDPRGIAYLLVWQDARDDEIKEAVRLRRFVGTFEDQVELKRTDGSVTLLRNVWRSLPRNGGLALLLECPHCRNPRRDIYGWEWDSFSGWSNRVRSVSWRCRSCARLRYSSEGGYLHPTGLGRLGLLGVMLRSYGNLPRPKPWLPLVFTSPEEMSEAGVCELASLNWYGRR